MDDVHVFLRRQESRPKPQIHQELFKRYVCQPISQENVGMVDVLVVEQML
jgi:hypothetical protein